MRGQTVFYGKLSYTFFITFCLLFEIANLLRRTQLWKIIKYLGVHFQIFVKLKKGCVQFALKNPCFDPIPRMYVHYPKNPISDTRSVTNRVYKTMLLSSCLFSIFCLHDVREWEDDDGSRSRCFCYFCLENDETTEV